MERGGHLEADKNDDPESDLEDFVRPTQESLDELGEQLREIQVCEWVLEGRALRPVALLTIQDSERLAHLMTHLRIVETDEWQHCMCVGSIVIVAVTRAGLTTRITIHHGDLLRWNDKWGSDATLADRWGLARWLAEEGVPELLAEMNDARAMD